MSRLPGAKNRAKYKKDLVVGDGIVPQDGLVSTLSAPPAIYGSTAELVESDAAQILQQYHEDILELYESGVHPRDIAKKFPIYTAEQILELCHGNFDLSAITTGNIDAILMKGFLTDMVRIKKFIEQNQDTPGLQLAAMNVLVTTRDRTARFRLAIDPILARNFKEKAFEGATAIETIEQRIQEKIKCLPSLQERQAFLRKLEIANASELEQLLEGEFRLLPNPEEQDDEQEEQEEQLEDESTDDQSL